MSRAMRVLSRRSVFRLLPTMVVGLAMVAFVAAALAEQAAPTAFERIPDASVNAAQKTQAQKVANALLTGWKAGQYNPLGNDFSDQMKTGLPAEKQRQSYAVIKATFGDYQSMSFAEAHRSKNGMPVTVYRFRGTFAKTSTTPEIRVVLDQAGKVAGFFVLAWIDQFPPNI